VWDACVCGVVGCVVHGAWAARVWVGLFGGGLVVCGGEGGSGGDGGVNGAGVEMVLLSALRRSVTHAADLPTNAPASRRTPRRWAPKLNRCAPRKKATHTAMSDIRESLEELRYYKEKLFRGHK